MTVELRFVTPLWTADATGDARRVVGTGLMGSLRWWYETLIRGLGGWACDPAGDDGRCALDADTFAKRRARGCEHAGEGRLCPDCEVEALAESGLCAACQVFGATGWAKVFRLGIDDRTTRKYPLTAVADSEGEVTSSRSVKVVPTSDGRGYFFPPGRSGSITLTLLPRRPNDVEIVPLLLGLLEFIRRNAALGAKTNLGYGLFEWVEPPEEMPDPDRFVKMAISRARRGRVGAPGRWPDLQEMFFAEVALRRQWGPRDFADFKYDLRAAFREGEVIERLVSDDGRRQRLRHFLLGQVRRKPSQASKVKMALLPDRSTLRVWGWVPQDLREGGRTVSREGVMRLLDRQLRPRGNITRWREFNSKRDTVERLTETAAYLRSVMEE